VFGSGHVHVYLVRYVKHLQSVDGVVLYRKCFWNVFVLGCIWTQINTVSTGEICRLPHCREGRSIV
jgi:type III secretory pathway component EscU